MAERQMNKVLDKITKAQKTVVALCHGELKWIMSIPCDEDRDPDLVIGSALRAAKTEITQLAEQQQRTARAEAALEEAVKHANIRLVAAVLYAYCHQRREGWEEGPGPTECWERLVDEVCNLGLAGVEVASKWLEDHQSEISTARPLDINEALKTQPAEAEKLRARNQPCGCVVCYCEDEDRCTGCGARVCGEDYCVFSDREGALKVLYQPAKTDEKITHSTHCPQCGVPILEDMEGTYLGAGNRLCCSKSCAVILAPAETDDDVLARLAAAEEKDGGYKADWIGESKTFRELAARIRDVVRSLHCCVKLAEHRQKHQPAKTDDEPKEGEPDGK